jgi:hypothetical protein
MDLDCDKPHAFTTDFALPYAFCVDSVVLVLLLPCSEFQPRQAILRLNTFNPRSPNVSYITSETDTTEAIIGSKIENDHQSLAC